MDLTRVQRALTRSLRGLVLLASGLCVLVIVVGVLVLVQAQHDETQPAAASIVVGNAHGSGRPAPALQARLDHAMDLYRRGYVPRIILTGGAEAGAPLSEAAIARDYLLEQGLPARALLISEQGTTMWEQLQGAAAIARAHGIDTVLLVSDPLYMLRALKMSRDLNLVSHPSPTRTPPASEGPFNEVGAVLAETYRYLLYLFARR